MLTGVGLPELAAARWRAADPVHSWGCPPRTSCWSPTAAGAAPRFGLRGADAVARWPLGVLRRSESAGLTPRLRPLDGELAVVAAGRAARTRSAS